MIFGSLYKHNNLFFIQLNEGLCAGSGSLFMQRFLLVLFSLIQNYLRSTFRFAKGLAAVIRDYLRSTFHCAAGFAAVIPEGGLYVPDISCPKMGTKIMRTQGKIISTHRVYSQEFKREIVEAFE
ncbi:hypothetical protein, partial [Pedobacter sp. SYP-B3415]|uniref:hypothetical protein n=1 Tax=Pedobacter sp. SYP-B3415 TaxID=2496641 RepID=UPI0013EB6552